MMLMQNTLYNKDTQYKGDDVRLAITRFKPENVEKNQLYIFILSDCVNKSLVILDS